MADVTVTGNISNVELRFTQAGKPVLGFSLAENHNRKGDDGKWFTESTTWRKVSVWEKKGELLAEHLAQGNKVIVTGQEKLKEYDKQDGSKGQSIELTAREVGIVPMPPKQDGGNNYGQQQSPQSFPAPTGFNQQQQAQSDPWS